MSPEPPDRNGRKADGENELRPCCVCQETRRERDECVLLNGVDSPLCQEVIKVHQRCLRYYGFC